MTTQILQFVELSDEARKDAGRFGKIGKGDTVEVRVKRRTGAGCRGNAIPLLRHHRDHLRSDASPRARRSSIIASLPDADLTWAA